MDELLAGSGEEGGENFFLEGKEDFKEGKYSGNSGSKNPEEEK